MRSGLRILITNNTLAGRAGSELYVRDIAIGLMRRGHNPIAYSMVLGEVAEELRKATVPVIDDLAALNVAPDLIHGQHHLDAMCAMLHFPQVPALYVCHGWLPWEELPPVFPSIVRYIAVDDLCRERLVTTPGVAAEKVGTLYNFVDLNRFKSRSSLPERPRTALIFSNYAAEANFVGAIRAACKKFGIEQVDIIGLGAGNSVVQPENLLPNYDLVFAKARCALEAMAVGCAVIVADFPGLGGLVTPGNVQTLRRLNFGIRTMQALPITEETVFAELKRYDPESARQVSEWIREEADFDKALDWLEGYYEEVFAGRQTFSMASGLSCCSAASDYLRGLAPVIKSRGEAEQRARYADWLASQVQEAEHRTRHAEHLADQTRVISQENVQLNHQLQCTQASLAAIENSRAWRALSPYRSLRAWLRNLCAKWGTAHNF